MGKGRLELLAQGAGGGPRARPGPQLPSGSSIRAWWPGTGVCARQRARRLRHMRVEEPGSYSFSRVHLIMVSGERYKKMSLAYSSSSSSSSRVSRTRKMSWHSFRMRSTHGSSSNMME